MKIYIKNMVCNRCIAAVRFEFEKIGIFPVTVELGQVELLEDWNENDKRIVSQKLDLLGFELLENKNIIVIEKIKNRIVDLVHHQSVGLKINLSYYLAIHLDQDYTTLSQVFSEMEGVTIEQYYITQKIEKVKELLRYNQLSLSEIAFQMNYTDVAHLSNQFKKITGITPSNFKKLSKNIRIQIDRL